MYLALDRPDIQFSAKELCREFASPTRNSVTKLKHLVRYLVARPRLVLHFVYEDVSDYLDVFSDTDFGGCLRTRRSASGGVARLGSHVLKCLSKTQSTIALSSAEAELTGICQAACEALGLQAIVKDLGMNVKVRVHSDATAAIGICRRRGLSNIRHLAVADLWVQDQVRTGDFALKKVPGSENPAAMPTKHVEYLILVKHLEPLGLKLEDGRASTAPELTHG